MASRSSSVTFKTNYAVSKKIEPFYKGGRVQITQDGEYMFCACDSKVNVVDVATGTVVNCIEEDEEEEITTFALSKDDEILVTGSRSMMLKQWDWPANKCTRTWKAMHTASMASMAFDSSSTLLATGGCDSAIKVWDVPRQYCTHNLKGSTGVVHLVEFHPDTSKLQLFSSSMDNTIRVWDLQSSECVAQLENHYSSVTSLAFSPDSETLISSGRDKICTVWDLNTREAKGTIPVYESIESVVMLPEQGDFSCLGVNKQSLHFVTAGSKGILRVWDAASATCVHSQSLPCLPAAYRDQEDDLQTLMHCVLVPVKSQIVTVNSERNICMYDAQTFELRKQFAGCNGEVLDVRFLGPKDSHIVVATNSPQLKVFELMTSNCQILRGHTDIVLALDVFRRGRLFASCAKDRSIRIWRMNEHGNVFCIAQGLGHTQGVGALACSRMKENFVVTASKDNTMKVWCLPQFVTCKEPTAYHITNPDPSPAAPPAAPPVTNPDPSPPPAAPPTAPPVKNPAPAAPPATPPVTNPAPPSATPPATTTSATPATTTDATASTTAATTTTTSSKTATTSSKTATTTSKTATTTSKTATTTAATTAATAAATTATTAAATTATTAAATTATTAAATTATTTAATTAATAATTATTAATTATTAAPAKSSTSKSAKNVKIVESPTAPEAPAALEATVTTMPHDKDVNSVAVSPNDKLIATASQDKTAKLWTADNCVQLGTFVGHRRGLWCVQFSPVDQILATSSADGTVKLWNLQDFSCLKTFEGHEAPVLKIIFVSGGGQVLSSGADGLMKLWTINNNVCVRTFDAHNDKVLGLHANRRDNALVTGSTDSKVLLWKDVTQIELEEEQVKQEEQILKEQRLSNLLHKKKYLKALGLAISLDRPHTVLTVIKAILKEANGKEDLEKNLLKLRKDQKEAVLKFSITWNTNSRNYLEAQAVVETLLKHETPESLLQYEGIKTAVESLLPYTERHFQRLGRLLQASMFLDFMWQNMKLSDASKWDEEMDTL